MTPGVTPVSGGKPCDRAIARRAARRPTGPRPLRLGRAAPQRGVPGNWRDGRPTSGARAAAVVLTVAAVLLCGSPQRAGAADPPPKSDAGGAPQAASAWAQTSAAPERIPIDKIAPGAAQVTQLLAGFAAHLAPDREVARIAAALPALTAELDQQEARARTLLAEEPSLEMLGILDQLWRERQLRLAAWLELLSGRLSRLQDALDRLQDLHGTWTRTRAAALAEKAPAQVIHQIDSTLAGIEAAGLPNRAARDQTLALQGQVAQQVIHCEEGRARIAQLEQGAVGNIFTPISKPIWSPDLWAQGVSAAPKRLALITASYAEDIRSYLRDPAKHLPIHLGLFVLVLTALLAARRRVAQWATCGEDLSRVNPVFDHPVAAALLLAFMAATAIAAPTPWSVKQILGALALAPMIVLARPGMGPRVVPILYLLGILFALDTLRHSFGGYPPLVDQGIVFCASLAGLLALARPVQQDRERPADGPPPPIWRFLHALALTGFAIGLSASALGYLRLARLTTPAVLVGAADALWLYAFVAVATAVLAYALRVWPLRGLLMLRHHRVAIEARLHQLLMVLALFAWAARYLNYLGLWEPTLARIGPLLGTQLGLGSFSTSLGDILAFVGTMVFAYLISALVRFVLQEEVYPRTGIAPGVSYAASSVFHYVVVTLAFLMALGFLGVSLTQVTVLAGALGVGIGLGLQGVVNNFVSGLILLFERPINLGDAVQVGELQGWVRRIGIRASVLRTVQGAEIIVPNAELTTQQVTNWTLSDQQRRIDIPVGVSYGTAPRKVIELLEGVARAHPRVLPGPPPRALFMSYGDSAINFELRAWTDYAHWIEVQSDLTVAVYDAIYAAGLSFPFPQREVRLLSDGAHPALRGDRGPGETAA